MIDGPFAETKELIAGYWLWKVKSKHEAIDLVKRCPNPMPGESEIEIRSVFEMENFGDAMTPEMQQREKKLLEAAEKLARGVSNIAQHPFSVRANGSSKESWRELADFAIDEKMIAICSSRWLER